jgi:hypothetical protein
MFQKLALVRDLPQSLFNRANGLLEPLIERIKRHNPKSLMLLKSVIVMPPKAYRRTGEWKKSSKTLSDERYDPRQFLVAAETYRWISEDTESLRGEHYGMIC